MVIVISLIYYLPLSGVSFFPAAERTAVQAGGGMGGGVFPDNMETFIYEASIKLADIPSNVEYSRPKMLTFTFHTMKSGDLIGQIASSAGLNEDTLISVNNIRNTRLMQIGQVIKIPNQDGIFYTVREGDTLDSIAQAHETTVSHIKTANQLFADALTPNTSLFVPGGKMNWVTKQEINGDLFISPISGRFTSPFGFRRSPFTGERQFHGGIDLAAAQGTPVRAAMGGRAAHVGYDAVLGNFVILSHHSGFRTLYAHMHTVHVTPGANVATGERIGEVGSTGLSTGPHLHFEVHRNGVRVNPRALMR